MNAAERISDTEVVNHINRALSVATISIAANPKAKEKWLTEFTETVGRLVSQRLPTSEDLTQALDDFEEIHDRNGDWMPADEDHAYELYKLREIARIARS